MKKQTVSHQVHPFPPLFDEQSRILILGSFPSVASRQVNFFYGHPQNRFWKLMPLLLGEPPVQTIEEKAALMHRHHIALWDTIHSCDITGSSDSSIKNVTANDLSVILSKAPVRQIFCNGKTSYHLYVKYVQAQTGQGALCLPSTSPANAAWQMDRLLKDWSVLLPYLEENGER